LTVAERRLLVLAALCAKSNHRAPTWAELRRAIGVERGRLALTMLSLEQRGLIRFTHEPRSLEVTADGVAAALGRPKRRAA
jgi:hypothetical protein